MLPGKRKGGRIRQCHPRMITQALMLQQGQTGKKFEIVPIGMSVGQHLKTLCPVEKYGFYIGLQDFYRAAARLNRMIDGICGV